MGEGAYLLFIPSVLSGVVVGRDLRDCLLALQQPAPLAELGAALPRELLERCVALGILVDERPPEPPPASDTLVAWLHVTNACNLRCTYCYLAKTEEAMSAATGRTAVDAIVRSAALHGYRAIQLKFAGGEASLNFPLVWELHDYARLAADRRLALDAVVLSNGVGVARRSLLELRRRGIRLMISLDGFAADHDAQRVFANGRGSFAAVSRTIDRALEIGLRPEISVTVSGQTAGGLAALVSWLLDRDLPFSLNFYRENDCSAGFQELQLDERRIVAGMLAAFRAIEARLPERCLLGALVDRANLAAPHARACGAGESYLVVDQRGGVAKCQMEIERPITSIHAPDPLGVIRADTIGVRNLAVQEKQGCRDCAWRLWCAGGCAVATFRATGRYDIQSPNCGIYQALYPEALRLEGLRILKYGAAEHFSTNDKVTR
ncbi:MAG TPA: radical SAM protein [Roseiflexaceae bacterium]